MYGTVPFGLQKELECSWRNEGIGGSRVLAAGDIGGVLWPHSLSLSDGRGLTAGCRGSHCLLCAHVDLWNCLSINIVYCNERYPTVSVSLCSTPLSRGVCDRIKFAFKVHVKTRE